MPLPKSIQQQADALEALEKQQGNLPADPPDTPDTPPADTPPQPADPVPPAPPSDPRESDPEYWKQRFQTTQGVVAKIGEENQALREQNRQVIAQLTALSTQVAALSQKPAAPAADADDTPLLTDKDAEMFGADLIEMTQRAVSQETRKLNKIISKQAQQIDALLTKIEQTGQQVGQVQQSQATSVEESFWNALNSRLPNWRQLQDTPECQNWLVEGIPGTTLTWDNVLQTAAKQHNVGKVLEVFDMFRQRFPQYADAPAANPPSNKAKSELARQVAPSKTTAVTPVANAKAIYTADDFQRMGMEVVRLRQHGKLQEAAIREAEMDSALAEGRVR